jgi:hypothetical protein
MLNKVFNLLVEKVVKVIYTLVKVVCKLVKVKFSDFLNRVSIKPQIVEKVPEEGLAYEYKDWSIIVYKENKFWKWGVRAGCIIFIEDCATTKEEAIVSAEAWVDRHPDN